MGEGFVKVKGLDFSVNDEPIVFRGFGVGNWLNLEHFMIGLPGNESQIRRAIREVYGEERSRMFWQKFQDCYMGEGDFRFLQSLGVNVIRIPFNFRMFESDQAPYEYDETGFAPIDRILELCAKYRIYAILDLHAAPGGQNPDWHCDNPPGENLFWAYADFRRRVIALWRFIAEHYKDNPWVAAYDLMNEPVSIGHPPEMVPAFFEELVPAVREIDPNHLMFVEGDFYATDFSLFKPCPDPNVAYTFHYYAFFAFNELRGEGKQDQIEAAMFKAATLQDIRERLQRPVWCGETGIPLNQGDLPDYERLLGDTLEVFEKRQISWTLWCYKDARSMGAVHPQEDASWMTFSKKACEGWNFFKEFNDWSDVDRLGERFDADLDMGLRRKLHFRQMADGSLVMTEKFRALLKQIPFDELMTYPESFIFDNCETWPAIAEMVKKYTGK